MHTSPSSDLRLAAAITRAASAQTFYTIRLLVDKNLVDDAYRAYGYFRWVDDTLDQDALTRLERLAFLKRQQTLMETCYRGCPPTDMTPEERLLADLIERDTLPVATKNSGLQAYIRNMMAVMAFDADRRGRLISQRELNEYTHSLAVAVTEAMHYFIGHDEYSPAGEFRYLAVTGAHLTHILRDTLEDMEAGYFNIPRELVSANDVTAEEINSQTYQAWVKETVQKARSCFRLGRDYLAQVQNWRCRIAGFAYMHRFEVVLDCIEHENYMLRPDYPERKGYRRGIGMVGWALWMALHHRQPKLTEPATGFARSGAFADLPGVIGKS